MKKTLLTLGLCAASVAAYAAYPVAGKDYRLYNVDADLWGYFDGDSSRTFTVEELDEDDPYFVVHIGNGNQGGLCMINADGLYIDAHDGQWTPYLTDDFEGAIDFWLEETDEDDVYYIQDANTGGNGDGGGTYYALDNLEAGSQVYSDKQTSKSGSKWMFVEVGGSSDEGEGGETGGEEYTGTTYVEYATPAVGSKYYIVNVEAGLYTVFMDGTVFKLAEADLEDEYQIITLVEGINGYAIMNADGLYVNCNNGAWTPYLSDELDEDCDILFVEAEEEGTYYIADSNTAKGSNNDLGGSFYAMDSLEAGSQAYSDKQTNATGSVWMLVEIKESGIKNIAVESVAIDYNAPYEVYNIQGARVNSSADLKGFYIVRQGSAVQKRLF